MKYNFKQIFALGTSALLIGMTAMAGVGAANYPAPFVVSGYGNVAVVYGTGSGVAATDEGQATMIATGLMTLTTSVVGLGSDSIQLQRSTDKFNLGDNMTDFYTNLDEDELGVVLVDGIYYNDENEDFDYEQKLTLSSNIQMTHFRNRDYNNYEPTIGFHLIKNDAILNYTLEFTPNAAVGSTDFADLESTFIEILGKEYFISKVSSDGTTITLLDSATTTLLNQGETTTLNVGGNSYVVSIQAMSSSGVIFNINDQTTNRLGKGDTQKLPGGTTHIGVTDFQEATFQGADAFAKFSLGTGEIVLEHGVEVEINGDAISQIDEYDGHKLNAYITNASTDIETIVLEWLADDDVFLTSTSELTMPGFGAVKFTMGDFVTTADEKTTFNAGDPFSVTTTVKDGPVTIDLFYLNDTENGFGANLGASVAQHLITTNGTSPSVDLSLDNETYFVASWISGRDAETYVYELSNIKANGDKNETTLVNLAGGSNVVFKDVNDDKDVGRLRLTLTAANVDDETATVEITPISTGSTYADRVFTVEGLRLWLPVDAVTDTGVANWINLSDSSVVSWSMEFTEEDGDGTIANSNSFEIDISIDADDGIEADDAPSGVTMQQIGRTGDDYIGYVESELATRVDWTKDTSGLDAMEVTYHGEEAYAEVFVSSTDVVDGATPNIDAILVTDAEVSTVQSRNLVVVGGSCINSVAATLVGGSFCTTSWKTETEVGTGQFLIKSYANPYVTGNQIALLVAGYEREDTVNAAIYLRNIGVDTTVGNTYIGTTSTSATLQVA